MSFSLPTVYGYSINLSDQLHQFLREVGELDNFVDGIIKSIEEQDEMHLEEYKTIDSGFDWGESDQGGEFWAVMSDKFYQYKEAQRNPNRFKEVL